MYPIVGISVSKAGKGMVAQRAHNHCLETSICQSLSQTGHGEDCGKQRSRRSLWFPFLQNLDLGSVAAGEKGGGTPKGRRSRSLGDVGLMAHGAVPLPGRIRPSPLHTAPMAAHEDTAAAAAAAAPRTPHTPQVGLNVPRHGSPCMCACIPAHHQTGDLKFPVGACSPARKGPLAHA